MEKLKFLSGDILSPNKTGHELILCQQVNCAGVMGAGLAWQLHSAFPGLYEIYSLTCRNAKERSDLLGTVLYFNGNYNGYNFTIANLFGQDDCGWDRCYTDYAALRKALANVCCVATPLPARTLTTVRIPYKMGCGLSGGEWDSVYQIILDELVDHGIPVEIWKPSDVMNKMPDQRLEPLKKHLAVLESQAKYSLACRHAPCLFMPRPYPVNRTGTASPKKTWAVDLRKKS